MKLIVLCGGEADGRWVERPKYGIVKYAELGVSGSVNARAFDRNVLTYVARDYASPWPIPGWDLWLEEDFIRGGKENPTGDGIRPWWRRRVFATDEHHEKMIDAFVRFNGALAWMASARRSRRSMPRDESDQYHMRAERAVEDEVEKLCYLTHSNEEGGPETNG